MRGGVSGKVIAVATLLVLVAALVWAWVDGGREPVRDIALSVAVPGMPR